jgi:probable selenium-dependent hydroxylase accessory protein YqeC
VTSLIEALGIRPGIVCAVGAGGKKTLLYRIAAAWPGRVAITNTVYARLVPDEVGGPVFLSPAEELAATVRGTCERRFAYSLPEAKSGRQAGIEGERIAAIHRTANLDLTLVKADGARMRWLKAPRKNEPVLPPDTIRVLAVLSARALGEPLNDRIAHRPDAVGAAMGLRVGETVTPAAMARLFLSDRGVTSNLGSVSVVPVINMVDNEERRELARETATHILAGSTRFDRVVLTCLKNRDAVRAETIGRLDGACREARA